MISNHVIQNSRQHLRLHLNNMSIQTGTWIEPTIDRCYDELNLITQQISQLLNPSPERKTRNIIGSALASLTGLVTTEQLQDAIEQIDNQDAQDENLIQLTKLTTNQDHMKQVLKRIEYDLKQFHEGASKAVATMKHYAFALNLVQLTAHYKNQWLEISQSILSELPTLHTVTQQSINEAVKLCRSHYGTDNQDTRLGITDQQQVTQIFPSLQNSKAFYFTHTGQQSDSLITQVMMPIFQHGYTLNTLTNKHGSTSWLLLNRQRTNGALVNEQQRSSYHTHFQTTYISNRLVFLNTRETLCLVNNGEEEACNIHMHRIDDNHYLFTGNQQHPTTITCGERQSSVNLEPFQLIFLPRDCRLASPSYTIHEHTNAPFSHLLETIKTLKPTSNELLDIREPENQRSHKKMGLFALQFDAKQDTLEKEDFQGPISLLYQRLQRRLQQRRDQRNEMHSATLKIIWPTYLIGGILLATAALIALLLIYIIKYLSLIHI